MFGVAECVFAVAVMKITVIPVRVHTEGTAEAVVRRVVAVPVMARLPKHKKRITPQIHPAYPP